VQGDTLNIAILGLLLAAWLVAASVAIWVGLSLRNQAQKSLKQTARLGRLLETAPAIPMIVRSDGKLEASDRVARLMGFDRQLVSLADLVGRGDSGVEDEDWKQLDTNVRETQRSGTAFIQKLSLRGSDKRLLVRGNIADSQIYANGAALLWFFDLTDTVRESERLENEAKTARNAFAALAGLIEAAPIPIWHRGPDLRLSFVNQAYVSAVSGQSGDQVVDAEIELIEPVNDETAMVHASKAQAAGHALERMVSSTIAGERRQMRVFDIPLGETGVAGLAIDVQALMDARGDFRRLADAQRDLLDKMSAGVAQFAADRSLNFANLPFQRTFAFRDEWLASKPEFARVLDRMRDNGKMPEVRDFPQWRTERESWFQSAEPVEENWLLPDGMHLRLLAQPSPDGGLLLIFEDRTEQAQLASARDTLLRVRTATFDNLFEAIAVFAADGKLSIWNRRFAEIWAVEETVLAKHPRFDELLSALAKHLKQASHVSVLRELLQITISSREPRRSQMQFADGRVFQFSTVPLPDGNALIAMIDVTDSVQVEQALRERAGALAEADSIKGRFLANMSYEFRTPLTSIAGFAELLKQGIAGDLTPQAQEYVDAIAKSADRLSQQINTVLDFSQSEAGALPIVRKPVDITAMLTAVAHNHEGQMLARNMKLERDIHGSVGEVAGDEKRLTQVLDQLFDNAVHYGHDGGTILLHASGDRQNVVIVVSDNGPGMDARTQAAALDGFGRSQTGQNASQGLGLPLARQLVESHGGKMSLESRVNEGTTITIKLPRKAAVA
jgi:signal transduction histidine kinase/PAS domain-containing protein